MADHRRDLIMQEERGKRPKTDLTWKTAGLLKRYRKEFRRRKNESATRIGTEDSRKELRKRMGQSTASAEEGILPAQSQASVTNKKQSLRWVLDMALITKSYIAWPPLSFKCKKIGNLIQRRRANENGTAVEVSKM